MDYSLVARMSKDIPVIMSAPMVRAAWDGYKTMTRRMAWRVVTRSREFPGIEGQFLVASPWQKVKPGDRLWVRENWLSWRWNDSIKPSYFVEHWGDRDPRDYVGYPANNDIVRNDARVSNAPMKMDGKLRPAIHMPRWASRMTLIVTATKIEPLNYITHEDAVAEGASNDGGPGTMMGFISIWNRLYGNRAFDDMAQTEIVAITFRVIKANIDAPEAQAA
jgi:hypothetical protein